jgi:hypothetical protein
MSNDTILLMTVKEKKELFTSLRYDKRLVIWDRAHPGRNGMLVSSLLSECLVWGHSCEKNYDVSVNQSNY